MSDDKKSLYETLNEKVNRIHQAVKDAEQFAQEHKLTFELNFAYGMGGTFYPKISQKERQDLEDMGEFFPTQSGWISSSANC